MYPSHEDRPTYVPSGSEDNTEDEESYKELKNAGDNLSSKEDSIGADLESENSQNFDEWKEFYLEQLHFGWNEYFSLVLSLGSSSPRNKKYVAPIRGSI